MVWDVKSAEWVRGLSDDDILAATDEGSFQRGLDYAARGMVQQVATLNRGRVVVAKVAGSERDTYQTIVSLRSDPRDAVVEWGARCSCPVARDCKHAVAVVVSVREALGGSAGGVEPPPPSRPWEDALALLTRDPDPEPLTQGAPVALVVERVQAPVHTWGRERAPRLRLRPTRRTQAGHWAKKYSWGELLQRDSYTAAGAREGHRRAVSALYALHEAHTGMRRHTYGSGGDVHVDVLARLGGDDFALPDLNVGVGAQLRPALRIQPRRWCAVETEQPADTMGGKVALSSGVDHERGTPCPAQNQRGAQPGGPSADDHAIPDLVHDTTLPAPPPICQALLP